MQKDTELTMHVQLQSASSLSQTRHKNVLLHHGSILYLSRRRAVFMFFTRTIFKIPHIGRVATLFQILIYSEDNFIVGAMTRV